MDSVISVWIAGPTFGTAVVAQWILLRLKYRSELGKQHGQHVHHHQIMSRHMEQWKRQIGQLQHDLAAARLQVKQMSAGRVVRPQGESWMVEALNQMLDKAAPSRPSLPADGFAETQPSPHVQQRNDLLLR